MNNFQKIKQIESEIASIGGIFISAINESVFIKNPYDSSVWEVPYSESDGHIIFDGTKATCTTKGVSKSDKFTRETNKLKRALENVLISEDYQQAIGDLKKIITNLPFVEEAGQMPAGNPIVAQKCETCKGALTPTVPPTKDANGKPVLTCKKCEPAKSPAANPEVAQGVAKVNEQYDAIIAAARLFHDKDVNKTAVAYNALQTLLNEAYEYDTAFVNVAKKYNKFVENLIAVIGEKETAAIIEAYDWTNADIGSAAAKAVAVAKTKGITVNAVDAVKAFTAGYSEDINPVQTSPFIYNLQHDDTELNKFLQFRTGAFSIEAVKAISEELTRAFANRTLTSEELEKLGAYRSIVEYMLQTKQINDKVLMAVIEDFNKTFIKTDDEYNASPLGFRSRPEQLTGFIQGYAIRGVEQPEAK